MIYLVVTIITLIVVMIARMIMKFDPNKKKQSKEKTDQQISEYIDMLKKYQQKKK